MAKKNQNSICVSECADMRALHGWVSCICGAWRFFRMKKSHASLPKEATGEGLPAAQGSMQLSQVGTREYKRVDTAYRRTQQSAGRRVS